MAKPDLKFDEHNANQGTERGKELLDTSLRELGAGRSILVDKDGNVIAGNKTLAAAQKAGMKVRVVTSKRNELVVVQRPDLDLNESNGEARRLAYLDNRVSELDLAWNPDVLANDITEGLNFEALGFDEGELLLIVGEQDEEEVDAEPQLDKAEELLLKWKVKEGQIWQLGDHLLMCGDCTDESVVQKLLNGRKFNLLCTDPPYGVGIRGGEGGQMTIANDNIKDLPKLLSGCFAVMYQYADKKAAFYIAGPHGPQFYEFAKAILEADMVWKQTLIWAKNNIVLGRSDYQQKHEVFFYGNFGHGRIWNGGRKQKSVIEAELNRLKFTNENELQIVFDDEAYIVQGENLHAFQTEPDVIRVDKPQKSELHPTMKPLKLLRKMIRNSSMPGALVYEPFSGAGSTILASENEGRVCYAIELLPKYVAVDLQRWLDATGKQPVLLT